MSKNSVYRHHKTAAVIAYKQKDKSMNSVPRAHPTDSTTLIVKIFCQKGMKATKTEGAPHSKTHDGRHIKNNHHQMRQKCDQKQPVRQRDKFIVEDLKVNEGT